ncbi:MAG: M36 family metallopeptidase, partial [Acidobacteria bacterium]|nr:M36 family metallopeptidase [Acidobacteriota bacterium]
PVEASLAWLPIRQEDVRLVWNFQVHTLDRTHVYDLTVDAVSGEVWTRIDWVAADSYQVYPQPVESPNHTAPPPPADARVTVANPADPVASPFQWHDTNGFPGPEFIIPRGNSVHAFDDLNGDGLPPMVEPSGGLANNYVFPINLAGDPTTYTSASVTNLFYWNNTLHDVQYRYGFDEAAGNFQVNNYSGPAVGAGDPVQAHAQDGTCLNNAFMATPPDGTSPTMFMCLWNLTAPRRDGSLENSIVVHEYGHGISNRLVGGPSNVSCLGNRQQPGEGLSDWWSLAYTALPTDTGPQARGIGTYVLGQPPNGPGIRVLPYSTDNTVNPWTYANVSGMSIPHGVGSVWAQGAWEVYWALVNQYGFSTNL